jgi:hypothetical protein
MRVIVCGGRDFTRRVLLFKTMEDLHAQHRFAAFMQGGQRGADAIARDWARTHPEIERFACKADWGKHGNAAGPIRNTRMLEWHPDLVVAFPTGGPGTADMMRKARAAGVTVIEIK